MGWQDIIKVDPFQSSKEVQAKLEEAFKSMQNSALEALHLDSPITNAEEFVERTMNEFKEKLRRAFDENITGNLTGNSRHAPDKDLRKASPILEKLDPKEKKRVKKLLQSSQPTEFFGKDMTQLGDLITEMKSLDMMKGDKSLNKKIESFDEKNLEIVASAAELRKDYEVLYGQIRNMVYPKKKGDGKK